MAQVEKLDQLPVSQLETRLRECMEQRPDVAGRVLTAEEFSAYISWIVETYGSKYSGATKEMLPYFTPDNSMTEMAAQMVTSADHKRTLARLKATFSQQSDEEYIARGRDIAVGRMLRYMPAYWHTTTFFDLFYAFSGDCAVHFQDEVIHLHRGAVLIVAPGVLHAAPCYADDAVMCFYMMRAGTFKHVFWNQLGDDNLLSKFFRLALEGKQPSSYLYFDTQDDPQIRHLLFQIYEEHQLEEPYSDQMMNSLMRLMFLLMLRRYEGTARLPRTEYFYWKHQFSGILSYIQTHYDTATLAETARQFSYSPKQVGRIVKDCTGENFGDLIRSLKMKKAVELLRDRGYPPEHVSELVGYATVNSFYRAFTDYYGKPPLVWMQENR